MSVLVEGSLKCTECENVIEGVIAQANIYICPKCNNLLFGGKYPKNALYRMYKQYKKMGRDMKVESQNLLQLNILCEGLKGINKAIKLDVDKLVYKTKKKSFIVYLASKKYTYNVICTNGVDIKEYKDVSIHNVGGIFSAFLK